MEPRLVDASQLTVDSTSSRSQFEQLMVACEMFAQTILRDHELNSELTMSGCDLCTPARQVVGSTESRSYGRARFVRLHARCRLLAQPLLRHGWVYYGAVVKLGKPCLASPTTTRG